jgi:choline-glycine betaine transporter
MISEGGDVSSKRWISVTVSAVICFGAVYGIIKYPQYYSNTMYALMIFVSVMSGVATISQIISLTRGVPLISQPKEPTPPQEDKREPFTNA